MEKRYIHLYIMTILNYIRTSNVMKAYLICHKGVPHMSYNKNKQTSYTQYYSQNLWINTQIIHDKIDCLAKLNSNK